MAKSLLQLPSILRTHFSPQLLNKHCVCAIGYGSGVFPQSAKPGKNTIDLIIVVKDTNLFHTDMLAFKPTDYSGLSRYLGGPYLSFLQSYIFPAHFNHIITENTPIKYCITSLQTFNHDLTHWNLLSFAGRMHKPVLFNVLNQQIPTNLSNAILGNYKMGLSVGLLGLMGKVGQQGADLNKIWQRISHISYAGDIRHTMAVENPDKVNNIVNNNSAKFTQIYTPLISQLSRELRPGTLKLQQNKIHINYTPELIHTLLGKNWMPDILIKHLQSVNQGKYQNVTKYFLMNGVDCLKKEIDEKLGKVNKSSSVRMAGQNFMGASLLNNVKYLLKKIGKRRVK